MWSMDISIHPIAYSVGVRIELFKQGAAQSTNLPVLAWSPNYKIRHLPMLQLEIKAIETSETVTVLLPQGRSSSVCCWVMRDSPKFSSQICFMLLQFLSLDLTDTQKKYLCIMNKMGKTISAALMGFLH